MKRIALLGSTGSIGKNTLEVIRKFPGEFRVAALSAHSNTELLSAQVREFRPGLVCVTEESRGCPRDLGSGARLFRGISGLQEMIKDRGIDMVVLAMSGSSALLPLLRAIEEKKEIATANKEALVMAGPLINRLAGKKKVRIIPIDSEQSAIWQCLEGEDRSSLRKIYLTASGGPFRGYSSKRLRSITVSQALAHPRWKMGRKITVDSATLMNKGLEVMEAMALFGVARDKIEVVIHPESIVHSMVEFFDGVVMAQLSATDMRIAIQYAMSYPRRLPGSVKGLDFFRLKSLNFSRPEKNKFPCLDLALEAAGEGGTMPCVLNAANEASVSAFLDKRIGFVAIPEIISGVMRLHRNNRRPSLGDILAADRWAREEAGRMINDRRIR